MKVYDRIEEVLKQTVQFGVPGLAPHEFAITSVAVRPENDGGPKYQVNAREYVGCSEATLGRRMREMVVLGRLTSKTREGKTFKEFALAEVREPVAA